MKPVFDTSNLSTGNVTSDYQKSAYIRPHTEVKCNGLVSPEGKLRAFDLAFFKGNHLPPSITHKINNTPNEKLVLYIFREFKSKNTTKDWGWLITNEYHQPLLFVGKEDSSGRANAYKESVLDWFNIGRITEYVQREEKRLEDYIFDLKTIGMEPNAYSIQKNPNHYLPLNAFTPIHADSVKGIINKLRTTLLQDPKLMFRINVFGHISDEQYEQLPRAHRHIKYTYAQQAKA